MTTMGDSDSLLLLLPVLRRVTREFQFDWELISIAVSEERDKLCGDSALAAEKRSQLQQLNITSTFCRELFAGDYDYVNAGQHNETNDGVEPCGLGVTTTVNLEDMSLEELVEHVERKELQMQQRKEQIFQRVFSSLSNELGERVTTFTTADPTVAAYQEGIERKQAMQRLKERQQQEAEENKRLLQEREELRRRFDEGSTHGEGEDPLAVVPSTEIEANDAALIDHGADCLYDDPQEALRRASNLSEAAAIFLQNNAAERIGNRSSEESRNRGGALLDTTLDDLLGGEEFDILLSELEKEMDEMAPSKDDAGVEVPSTELAEVLSILDQAAASRPHKISKSSNSTHPHSILCNPADQELSLPTPPQKPVVPVIVADPPTAAELPPIKAVANVKVDPSTVQNREDGGGVRGRGLYFSNTSNFSTAAQESKDSSARSGTRRERMEKYSTHEEESGSSDGSDDENWRTMRSSIRNRIVQETGDPLLGHAELQSVWSAANPGAVPLMRKQSNNDRDGDMRANSEDVFGSDEDEESVNDGDSKIESAEIVVNVAPEISSFKGQLSEEDAGRDAEILSVTAEDRGVEKPEANLDSTTSLQHQYSVENLVLSKTEVSSPDHPAPVIEVSPNSKVSQPSTDANRSNSATATAATTLMNDSSGTLGGSVSAVGRRSRGKVGSIMGSSKTRKKVTQSPAVTTTESEAASNSIENNNSSVEMIEQSELPKSDETAAAEEPVTLPPLPSLRMMKLSSSATDSRRVASMPYSELTDKISGTTINCCAEVKHFTNVDTSRLLSMDRLIAVTISDAKLQCQSRSSLPLLLMTQQVIHIAESSGLFKLLSLQTFTTESNLLEMWLLFECVQSGVSSVDLYGIVSTIDIKSISAIAATQSVTSMDCILISDGLSTDQIHFRAVIEAFAHQQWGNEIHYALPWAQFLTLTTTPRSFGVCVIKPYMTAQCLADSSNESAKGSLPLLQRLVAECEALGLQLCGMRLAYLSERDTATYARYTSVTHFHRASTSKDQLDEGKVLCLAWQYSETMMSSKVMPEEGQHHALNDDRERKVSSPAVKSSSRATALLRTVLGPEDPQLARATDPSSIRAVYGGTSKEENVAYPVPHTADHAMDELSFWFNGRPVVERDKEMGIVAPLHLTPPRMLKCGFRIESTVTSVSTRSSMEFSMLQQAVISCVKDVLSGSCASLIGFEVFGDEDKYRSALDNSSSIVLVKHRAADILQEGKVVHIFMLFTFFCSAGDRFIAQSMDAVSSRLATMVEQRNMMLWTVAITFIVQSVSLTELSKEERDETIVVAAPLYCPVTANTGSRLVALDVQRKLAEECFRSHEDVGLPDVIVLSVAARGTHTQRTTPLAERVRTAPERIDFLLYLQLLLNLLPKTCEVNVIAGCFTFDTTLIYRFGHTLNGNEEPHDDGVNASTGSPQLVVALRGYQLLENIDHALVQLRQCRVASEMSDATSGKHIPASHRKGMDDELLPVLIRSFKGKKAAELLFQTFNPRDVFCSLATRDMFTYIPSQNINNSGMAWYEQAEASGHVVDAKESNVVAAATIGKVVPSPSSCAIAMQIARALFPPGTFSASAVLILPWEYDGAIMTRNIARVTARLEKEGFAVIEMNAVSAVSFKLLKLLFDENVSEYSHYHNNRLHETDGDAICTAASRNIDKYGAVVLLVRRQSALLRLKSVIGPIFDEKVAEQQYPRSLACLLHSLNAASTQTGQRSIKRAAIDSVQRIPYIFPSLTCVSAQMAIKELFPRFHNQVQLQLHAPSLNNCSNYDTVNEEQLGAAHKATPHIASDIMAKVVHRLLHYDSLSESELKFSTYSEVGGEDGAARVDTVTAIRAKSADMAGIAITYDLLQRHGIGLILEVLHREGLMVRNVATAVLTATAAARALELAGASSLSMKPPMSCFVGAGDNNSSLQPTLFLGLEGPMHSFVRFKSFSIDARTSTSLWSFGSTNKVSSSNVEWGVLASSSSRLAKDLYRHCFREIYGGDSSFVIVNAANESEA